MFMFSEGSYAKVWKITSHDNYTDIQCSTQQKKEGKYVTDYSGFARLVCDAHKKAVDLAEGDSIKIGRFGVTNFYDRTKKINYTNIIMFDYETKEQEESNVVNDDSDELPFS